jgi:hypothetical protein
MGPIEMEEVISAFVVSPTKVQEPTSGFEPELLEWLLFLQATEKRRQKERPKTTDRFNIAYGFVCG